MPSSETLSVSVIVVTLSRAEYVRKCLHHLGRQTVQPGEIIVVDASPDDLTYRLVTEEFPAVRYVRNPAGAGKTGLSRNLGLADATGDVVAFIDDDAFAQPNWLAELLKPYADPAVGGVGGQAKRDIAGEEGAGLDDIGRLHSDGTLSGNFAADPGRLVEVDHFLGANMSFRRTALVELGGIRDGYPGTCLREETDLAFRIRAAGWRLVYNPAASVDHVAAPYPKGQRFDLRYTYFGNRNHVVLLARNFGFSDPIFRRYLGVSTAEARRHLRRAATVVREMPDVGATQTARSAAGALSRAAASVAGTVVGVIAGYHQRRLDRAHGPAASPSTGLAG